MAKPKPGGKGRNKGPQGVGISGLGAPLAAGSAALVILAIFAFSLKSQLIKPSRIAGAAESSGLYERLPRLMFGQVLGQGQLNIQKRMKLKEAKVMQMSEEIFDIDWVVEEFEAIIYDAADAIKAGDPISAELQLEAIKPNLVGSLFKVISENTDKVPKCSGSMKAGRDLCIPKGVSRSMFVSRLRPELQKIIDKVPDRYPLLPRETAAQISDATGIFGTISTLGIVFLLLSVGLGVGAFKMYDDDCPPWMCSVGAGLGAGGLVLFVVVMLVRKGIGAGVGALVQTLESGVGQVVDQFFGDVISGGFQFATVLAVLAILGGAGLFYMGHQQT